MIRAMSNADSGNGASGPPSEAFTELVSLLRDPHRHSVARMWGEVAQSDLSPEERQLAETLSPVVHRYLTRATDREEYEQEVMEANIPSATDSTPQAPPPAPE